MLGLARMQEIRSKAIHLMGCDFYGSPDVASDCRNVAFSRPYYGGGNGVFVGMV